MSSEYNILVVDDDAYLLDLMIETLSVIGYKAIGASDAKQALQVLQSSSIDLVITDIKMPEMNGLEFSQAVQREYPDIPIIFISGAFTPSILRQIENKPFIHKPFRINQVEKVIEEILVSSRTGKETNDKEIILVVDDDDNFRYMLIESLKLSGYDVTGVSDGLKAIERLKKNDIGAVITDAKMPGLDGISLSKYIRRQWPEIPIILMTAYLNLKQTPNLHEKYIDGYLMKPFKIESITALLDNVRKGRTNTEFMSQQ